MQLELLIRDSFIYLLIFNGEYMQLRKLDE